MEDSAGLSLSESLQGDSWACLDQTDLILELTTDSSHQPNPFWIDLYLFEEFVPQTFQISCQSQKKIARMERMMVCVRG